MANKGSAEKRHRQSLKRRLSNKMTKSTIHTAKRNFLDAVKASDKVAAEDKLKLVVKLLDTAASKGVYHQNTVARKVSRLQKLLNKV